MRWPTTNSKVLLVPGPFRPGDICPGDIVTVRYHGRLIAGKVYAVSEIAVHFT